MGIYKNGIWTQNEFNERLLPDGYTQLEYIESTGTQYINTGYIIQSNCAAKYKFLITNNLLGSCIGGVYNNGNDIYFGLIRTADSKLNYRYKADFYLSNTIMELNKEYEVEVILNQNIQYLIINNIREANSTNTNLINNNTLPLTLFNTNGLSQFLTGKIYYFKLYQNDKLVRDFIPALRNSDNIAGLYDLVNDVFYTNAGTGDFKYVLKGIPSDYTQLEYIEGTGTQYINTNYKPYKTTTEIKFQYNSIPSTNGVTLCGVYNDNNNRYYALSYETATGITSSSRTNTKISLLNPADIDIHTLIYNDSNNKVFLDGIEKGTVTNLTTTSTNPLYLFARRGSSSAEVISIGRIYYCKIWEENELVRDFIPVKRKSDDVLGLYDKTNNTFYINNGTGTFIGSDSYAETANVKIYKETNALEANEFWEI